MRGGIGGLLEMLLDEARPITVPSSAQCLQQSDPKAIWISHFTLSRHRRSEPESGAMVT
jgi:hypothetical protein